MTAGSQITGSFALAGNSVTFTPTNDLPDNSTIFVSVFEGGVGDTSGNEVLTTTTSFFTTMRATGTVTGTVFEADGTTVILSPAQVELVLAAAGVRRNMSTIIGVYAFDDVALYSYTVTAIQSSTALQEAASGTLSEACDTEVTDMYFAAEPSGEPTAGQLACVQDGIPPDVVEELQSGSRPATSDDQDVLRGCGMSAPTGGATLATAVPEWLVSVSRRCSDAVLASLVGPSTAEVGDVVVGEARGSSGKCPIINYSYSVVQGIASLTSNGPLVDVVPGAVGVVSVRVTV